MNIRTYPELADLLARAIIDNHRRDPRRRRAGAGYDAELDELQSLSENASRYLMDGSPREGPHRPGQPQGRLQPRARLLHRAAEQARSRIGAGKPYIRQQTLKGAEHFITPELKEFEDKALSADRALAREKLLYDELLEHLIGHLAPLQDTAAALAELDVLEQPGRARAEPRPQPPALRRRTLHAHQPGSPPSGRAGAGHAVRGQRSGGWTTTPAC